MCIATTHPMRQISSFGAQRPRTNSPTDAHPGGLSRFVPHMRRSPSSSAFHTLQLVAATHDVGTQRTLRYSLVPSYSDDSHRQPPMAVRNHYTRTPVRMPNDFPSSSPRVMGCGLPWWTSVHSQGATIGEDSRGHHSGSGQRAREVWLADHGLLSLNED
ncbi:hypothetical protein LZ32DRAFT_324325 [Colletotrichum eremochloae]|nr:hypothetical protein LZ32DRAFT_324325 [Colletotrichum eremochloae]